MVQLPVVRDHGAERPHMGKRSIGARTTTPAGADVLLYERREVPSVRRSAPSDDRVTYGERALIIC